MNIPVTMGDHSDHIYNNSVIQTTRTTIVNNNNDYRNSTMKTAIQEHNGSKYIGISNSISILFLTQQ